jgi:hypothetical protein
MSLSAFFKITCFLLSEFVFKFLIIYFESGLVGKYEITVDEALACGFEFMSEEEFKQIFGENYDP